MKRKIKYLVASLCISVFAVFAGGCSITDTLKQWSCEHDYGAVAKEVTKAATCTEKGEELWQCVKCGKEKTESTEKAEHQYDPGRVVKPATCTATGEMWYECVNCDDVKSEVIKMTDHKRKDVGMVAPTCTKDGASAFAYCTECNTFLVPKVKIEKLGHSPVTDKAVAATCTESGKTEGKHCAVCNEVLKEQESIPAKGHTIVTDRAVEASCETAGKTAGSHCSTCNAVIVAQVEIPAWGHDYGNDNTCDNCGTHRHTIVTDSRVDPTCTTVGKTEGSHCSECLIVITAQEQIPALGHSVGEGGICTVCGEEHAHTAYAIEAKAPTCTEAGRTAGSACSDCGKAITGGEEIPALGHTLITKPAVAATCTASGSTEDSYCSTCGEVFAESTVVPALGHKDTNGDGVCENAGCQEELYGLTYALSDGGTYYIVTGASEDISEVTVPLNLCGKPVSEIADRAFEGMSVSLLTLSNNPTMTIGEYAFADTNVYGIKGSDETFITIERYAFADTCIDEPLYFMSIDIGEFAFRQAHGEYYAETQIDGLTHIHIYTQYIQDLHSTAFDHSQGVVYILGPEQFYYIDGIYISKPYAMFVLVNDTAKNNFCDGAVEWSSGYGNVYTQAEWIADGQKFYPTREEWDNAEKTEI